MTTTVQNTNNEALEYTKLDANMRDLARVLNSFPGVSTVGSCGGHENPNKAQWPKSHYYIKFDMEWNVHGYFSLEFLAWAINEWYGSEHIVSLMPIAPPPYLNFPGEGLSFVIEGHKEDPQELADFLNYAKDVFISADVYLSSEKGDNGHFESGSRDSLES